MGIRGRSPLSLEPLQAESGSHPADALVTGIFDPRPEPRRSSGATVGLRQVQERSITVLRRPVHCNDRFPAAVSARAAAAITCRGNRFRAPRMLAICSDAPGEPIIGCVPAHLALEGGQAGVLVDHQQLGSVMAAKSGTAPLQCGGHTVWCAAPAVSHAEAAS